MDDRFIDFVRYSIGTSEEAPAGMTPGEWELLYCKAHSHAVLGVCASGIERLPEERRPPRPLALRWAADTMKIEERNRLSNRRCVELAEMLRAAGFKPCILKGQGAALYYPDPLRRQSGDIDVWVGGGHRSVMKYVRSLFPKEGAYYHHADFPVFADVPVEIHFIPSWLSSPMANARFRKWFTQREAAVQANLVELPEGAGSIAVPTVEFNLVYMLLHIYRHLFSEGIGLRQCLDYYYLLKTYDANGKPGLDSVISCLHRLGLYDFAGAVMHVMSEVFGAPRQMLPVPPRVGDGRFVVRQILRSGNFGCENNIDRGRGKNLLFYTRKLKYKLHYASRYPAETLWGLAFSLWQKLWIRCNGYA